MVSFDRSVALVLRRIAAHYILNQFLLLLLLAQDLDELDGVRLETRVDHEVADFCTQARDEDFEHHHED